MPASQIPMTSQLVRQNDADFPLADTVDLAGGLMSVADVVARDAIAINSPSLLRAGMMVFTVAEDRYWKLLTVSPVVWEQLGVQGSTLASAYAAGSTSTDQTIPVSAVQGGPPIFKAAAAATGSLLKALTSAGATLLDISDNATQVIKSSVADGAGSVGFLLEAVNDIVVGKVLTLRAGGVDLFSVLKDEFSSYLRGREYAFFQAADLTGLFLAPNTFTVQVAGADVVTAFFDQLSPTTSFGAQLGRSSAIYSEVWGRRHAGVQRNVSAAASITLNTALGGVQRIALGATAITTVNGSAGRPAEMMVVEVLQDGTGGRSISGWSTSTNGFVFAGGSYTPTVTANKRDVLTFVWDETNSKWYETARSMNL